MHSYLFSRIALHSPGDVTLPLSIPSAFQPRTPHIDGQGASQPSESVGLAAVAALDGAQTQGRPPVRC